MDGLEVFKVGCVYVSPYDRTWLCKVDSRTPHSIRVRTKSVKESRFTDPITLRLSIMEGIEVAKGSGWLFWASELRH